MKSALLTRKSIAVCAAILLIALSVASIASTSANVPPGCSHVQGRLFNGTPGRMIGTISGDYLYDTDAGLYIPDDTGVWFMSSTSHVEGTEGTIFFNEYSAVDTDEYDGTNGAVLALVTGGTGRWENASGHVVFSGYFHMNTWTGVWDYQGEVCFP